MKKLFEISSEEKQRILEMHETATKKNYLGEQSTEPPQKVPTAVTNSREIEAKFGKTKVMLPGITNTNQLEAFVDYDDLQANLKKYMPGVQSLPKTASGDAQSYTDSTYMTVARLFNEGLMKIVQTGKNTDGLCTWADGQSQAILSGIYKTDVSIDDKEKEVIMYYVNNKTLYPAFTKLVKDRVSKIYDCNTKEAKLV